mgnify:CR=1 FL=1
MASPPRSHTKTLLSIRTQALKNRLSHLPQTQKIGLILCALALAIFLFTTGYLQAPDLLKTPDATTLPANMGSRSQLITGASALDLAFWLSAFCSSVFSFRIMEFLFRDNSIRSIDNLPLPMHTIFIDRLVRGLVEALAWGIIPALFFVALIPHNPWVGLATLILCFGGPLLTLGSGVGVQLFFGGSEFGKTQDTERKAVDGYGSTGQLFLFAPAAALAASVVLVMLLKLSLGEMVRLESWNRATSLGVGIGVITVVIALAVGWANFKAHYFRMLAGFREADFVGFDLPIDYQTSDFEKARFPENLLPQPARFAYRRTLLQYARRYALIRYLYALLWLLAVVALFQFDRDALPSWTLAAVPLLLLATLANPFVRSAQPGIKVVSSQPGRLSNHHETLAETVVNIRETLLFTTPFAAIILVMLGLRAGELQESLLILGVILTGALAQAGVSMVMNARLQAASNTHYIGALFSTLLVGWLSSQQLLWGIILATLIAVISIALSLTSSQSKHATT